MRKFGKFMFFLTAGLVFAGAARGNGLADITYGEYVAAAVADDSTSVLAADSNGFYAGAVGRNHVEVEYGATATFSVMAVCDEGQIFYQWMDEYFNEIGGATQSTYTIDAVDDYYELICCVYDEFDNVDYIPFSVTYLKVWPETSDSMFVVPGESVTMEMGVSSREGKADFYWEKEYTDLQGDFHREIVPGVTDTVLTVDEVNSSAVYTCYAESHGRSFASCRFSVSVENHMTAEIDSSSVLTPAPGETAICKVNASCDNGNLAYVWKTSGGSVIEEADTETLILENQTQNEHYSCTVTDIYLNRKTITFNIKVDNEFTAEVDGNGGDTRFYAKPNGSVTLGVIASCKVGSLSYTWKNQTGYPAAQMDVTGPSCTIENVTGTQYYSCLVRDEYGNSRGFSFTVFVDNSLRVERVGEYTVYVKPGGIADLSVSASCETGTLTYTWKNEKGEVLDADGSSITTAPQYQKQLYSCRVDDEYGNYEYIGFQIVIDNEFTAEYGSTQVNYVKPGGSIELVIQASCADGNLTYSWTRSQKGNTVDVETANDGTCYVKDIDYNTNYICTVSDSYGSQKSFSFRIYIDNQLTVTAPELPSIVDVRTAIYYTGLDITLETDYNSPVTLSVPASCSHGSLTYTWLSGAYNSTQTKIADASGDTLVTDPILKSGCYVGLVEDEYGNTQAISYYINVRNHLKVESVGPTALTVPYDASVTLKVQASCDTGSISYIWRSVFSPVSDEFGNPCTTDTCTVKNIRKNATYRLIATDIYGNTREVRFEIKMRDGETGEESINLLAGQTVVLPALNGFGDYVETETDSSLLQISDRSITALSGGEADVDLVYSDYTLCYHITIYDDPPVVKLPAALIKINQDAFYGDEAVEFLEIGADVALMETASFAHTSLKEMIVYSRDVEFEYADITSLLSGPLHNLKPTIVCYEGSTAQSFAARIGSAYVFLP